MANWSYFQYILHNDDNQVVCCANKRIPPSGKNVRDFLRILYDCTVIKDTKPSFPFIYMKCTTYYGTTTSGTQPRKNMTTMGKINISDLVMMLRWVMNMSCRPPICGWASLTHSPTYCDGNKEDNRNYWVYLRRTLDRIYPTCIYAHLKNLSRLCSMQVRKST